LLQKPVMRKNMAIFATAAAATALLSTASAAHAETWAFGARVGGYGFRQVDTAGQTTWDDCRMDGSGVFAQRSLTRHAFLEGGLDLYQARGDTVMTEGMDRTSAHATVAAGLRMFPGRLVSPYVQVGVGAEYTDVTMGDHGDTRLLPSGFFGIGAEVRLGRRLRAGMNVRFHMMGHFDHGGHSPEAGATAVEDEHGMAVEAAPASQGQFFLSYEM
jgi:hypothetical protein